MAVCFALVGTAAAASGQTAAFDDSMDEAADRVRAAHEAVDQKGDWGRASILYAEAAELAAGDPIAADHHRKAGMLAYYAGREGHAVDHLTRAAQTALEWGDVVGAARSFLDAAWVAHEDGKSQTTLDLAERAERLARSPLMARADRADLMRRLAEPQAPEFAPGS